MAEVLITSTQNPHIKRLQALQQKSSERRQQGLFVVEGKRELAQCVKAGYGIEALFCCPSLLGDEQLQAWMATQLQGRCFEVSETLYARIAYRGTTEGVLALVSPKPAVFSSLHLSESPLIVVLERVEKPGNLGAVLRTADAARADAVIVCDPLTDLYNPNLIRASLGAIFTVPCVACSSDECIRFLKERGIQILTAQLQDSHLYYDTDMRRATAIVMGTESTGLSSQWREAADAHIRIPMLGEVDSLNVSVSAAILLFEAVRQRM
ncbi:MAG: RNA methyltransferase [Bacteroidaceae bacterium]|nr:RNA methyltransferase [Bacteroidaceae bacterium]